MYMVRGSELNDFLRCRLRWRWAWIDGLRSKKSNNKLFFGTLFHKFLEVYYSTGDFNLATAQTKELMETTDTSGMDEVEYLELNNTLWEVISNYWLQYSDDFDNWETIATELTFAIPLDDEIGYTGTIDLIIRDKRDGKIYFLDHKTTSSIDKYDKNSDMDRQLSRYWFALQELTKGNGLVKWPSGEWTEPVLHPEVGRLMGAEIGGFIYNIILRDYPVPPKVLKNGSLSKDKSQKTTFELYLQTLIDRGIAQRPEEVKGDGYDVPIEYHEILDYLRDSPKEFFRRIQVIRNQAEIDSAMTELYATAEDMHKIAYDSTKADIQRKTYRNITTNCPWDCQFFDLCKATLDGSNADFLIDSLYTREETNNVIRDSKTC